MFLYLNRNFIASCDAPEPWQLGASDPATPAMEGMIDFHNYLMIFVIAIGIFVLWMLYKLTVNFPEVHPVSEKFTHSSLLEIVWTIIPALILMLIAVPSFGLLYSLDELIDPTVTLKVQLDINGIGVMNTLIMLL